MSTDHFESNLASREDFEELDLGFNFYTGVSSDGSKVLAQVELDEDQDIDAGEILAQVYNAFDGAETYTVEVEINERHVVTEDGYHEDFQNYYLESYSASADEVESMLE